MVDVICEEIKEEKRNTSQSSRTLGGCIYFLAVYYLDFLDFAFHQLPSHAPRISVWKGDMIKKYSQYDCVSVKGNLFGLRPVKDFSLACYGLLSSSSFDRSASNKVSHFRDSLERNLGNSFPAKVKEGISVIFQKFHENDPDVSCYKSEVLVRDVLNYLSIAATSDCANDRPSGDDDEYNMDDNGNGPDIDNSPRNEDHNQHLNNKDVNTDSQSTVKIPSVDSAHDNLNQQDANDGSQATMKLTSDESCRRTSPKQLTT